MIQKLADFVTDAPIFVDANIFLFHVFDDEKHGKAATSFLFGIISETKGSPWDILAGMFTASRPVDIEERLDARGFEETADYL